MLTSFFDKLQTLRLILGLQAAPAGSLRSSRVDFR
jgi:hypothetical protein